MSIIILILATICFFYFTVLPTVKHHMVYAVISFLIMVFSTGAIVANDTYHWGMDVQKTTKVRPLTSAVPQLDVLLYQPLGTGSEKVYLYHEHASEKKMKATKTEDSSAKYSSNAKNARLVITEERYVYKNKAAKFFFSILDNNNRLKHRTYDFQLTSDWYVLSTKQAKALQKLMQKNKAQLQASISQEIQQELATEMAKDPTMSTSKREQLLKEIQTNATKKLVQEMIAEVQKQ